MGLEGDGGAGGKSKKRNKEKKRQGQRKRDTLCSMSSVSTVEMCYKTGNTLHCSHCLAIRRSPHAVTELLLPVKMKEESSVPPHLHFSFPPQNRVWNLSANHLHYSVLRY